MMIRRAVELLLLVAAGLGGLLAWQTGRGRARLEAVHDRLTREVGELPIGDPSKVLIRAVEAGEPLHFAWQVHLPANYTVRLKHTGGGVGKTPSPSPRDFLARFRLREDGEGRLQAFVQFANSNGMFSLGDRRLADFLRSRSGEVLVERPGVADTAVIEPDGSATLLRLSLPEKYRREAIEAHPGHYEGGSPLVLFEMTLKPGPTKP